MKNYKLNYSVKADKLKLVKKFVTVAAIAFLTTGAPVATAVLNAASAPSQVVAAPLSAASEKLVNDYFDAKNNLEDLKVDLADGSATQAQVDAAQKVFDTAKAAVAKDTDAQQQVTADEKAHEASVLATQKLVADNHARSVADRAHAAEAKVLATKNLAAVTAAEKVLSDAKTELKTATDAKKPAAEIAALQAKVNLAQAKVDLASAQLKAGLNTNSLAVKDAQTKVDTAQKAVDALPATQAKAPTTSQTPATGQTPATSASDKLVDSYFEAKNNLEDLKVDLDGGFATQAQVDAAQKVFDAAKAEVAKDPEAQKQVTADEKAHEASVLATQKLVADNHARSVADRVHAPEARALATKNLAAANAADKALADANAALKAAQVAKKPAAEIAALQAKVNLAKANQQLALAKLHDGLDTNGLATKAALSKVADAQKVVNAQGAAKAAADKAYAAAHPAFKVFVNGKQVTNGNYTNRATYRLNAGVARATHVNGGVVRINKTRTGYTLSGLRASRGFKITSIRLFKGANGTFGFNVSTAKVINLTVNAHFGRHSKVVGHGEFANNAKTRVNARGYHFHGTAKVVITTRHHRTTTKVVGLSADRHYKITKITISNSHGNKVVNVTVKKR